MPACDYRCKANAQIIEVRHRMNEVVRDWADLCMRRTMCPNGRQGDPVSDV